MPDTTPALALNSKLYQRTCNQRCRCGQRFQREVIELERSYTLRILPDDLPARGLT